MKPNQTKDITYAEAAKIADARTISALIAIGSPQLELDEEGRVAVLGGMSQTMMRAYGAAYLGQTNGTLWANLGYPMETSDCERPEPHQQSEMSFTGGQLQELYSRKSKNVALFQLLVVIAVAVTLWFSGFNVLVNEWISAYIGTWLISPIAGLVFSVITFGFYRLLEAIKRIL